MAKLPYFQFYPGDWRKDPDLSRCSFGAKGLLADLLCLMHENHHRGILCERDGITPWSNGDIATAVGGSAEQFAIYLCELETKNVLKRNDNGCLCSSRMIRDEQIRTERAAAGKRGGKAKHVAKAKQKSSKHPSKTLANDLAKGKQNPEYEYVYEDEDDSSSEKGIVKGKPNPLWDAFVAYFYPSGVAPGSRKEVGALVRDLKAVGAKPEEISARAANYATHMPDCPCTPRALVKHWELCRDPKQNRELGRIRTNPNRYAALTARAAAEARAFAERGASADAAQQTFPIGDAEPREDTGSTA